MDSVFPEDVNEAAEKLGNDWVKPDEFDGEGATLQIKGVEKIASRNPKYGAVETDYLVKNDVLEVGQTFQYTFADKEGVVRKLDSKSTPFFIAFKQANPAPDAWVRIQRTGKTTETRYTVEVVGGDKPVEKIPTVQIDEDPNAIPF